MGRLDGKVAVITGAASGMGASTARLFAAEGASVVIADIDDEGGKAVAEDCVAAGGNVVFQHGDVREEQGVAEAVERAVAEFSKLDIMFNNAGAGGAIGLEGVSADGWDNTHALLLRSVFFGIKHSAPHLRANHGGAIISTSSAAGIRPLPATHAYSTFKAGVIKLTESAAQELGPHNIRVNAIAPGWIMTPLLAQSFPGGAATLEQIAVHAQPIRRCGRGDDIARAALFLASDESSFITGVTLPVDGGWLVQAFQNPRVEAELAKLTSEAPTWME